MANMTMVEANALATKWGTDAAYAALYTTAPSNMTAGTEPTGGSPAYARKALTFGTASGGVVTATVTFDVPAGTTVVGAGVHSAATGGSYLHGGAVTSQTFASQGTYTLTVQYTQS